MRIERLELGSFPNVAAVLAHVEKLADEGNSVGYGTFRYIPADKVREYAQMFRWRYEQGLKWPILFGRVKDSDRPISDQQVRKHVDVMVGLVEWATRGVSQTTVYRPTPDVPKTDAARALREGLLSLEDRAKGKSKRSTSSMLAMVTAAENRGATVDDDVPVFALSGPAEANRDWRMRLRLKRSTSIAFTYGVRKADINNRTLTQNMALLAVGRSTNAMRKAYQMGGKTMTRLLASSLNEPFAMERLVDEIPGWAALAMLTNHGLGALPVGALADLFPPHIAETIEPLYASVRSKSSTFKNMPHTEETYGRRLWRYFGGTDGLLAALPAGVRSPEAAKVLFRAVRAHVEMVRFKSDGTMKQPSRDLAFCISALCKGGTPKSGKMRYCRQCELQLPIEDFPWKSRVNLLRHYRCKDCTKQSPSEPMTEEMKRQFKLLKIARRSAAQIADSSTTKAPKIKMVRPPKPRKLEVIHPSTLEEFVITMDFAVHEAQKRERKAERKADGMMARAVGRNPDYDLDEFMTTLRG